MKPVFVLFLGLSFAYAAPSQPKAGCGITSCPQPKQGELNIHLIAHTHNDPGYLNILEQHYYHSVQYILDTVTDSLINDPNKKFIYAETGLFWKWWQTLDADYQGKVKNLVNNGQLEFVGGGWSMSDEATTNYQSTIDHISNSLRKLNDTFGSCGLPRVGWQVDTFGHSRETSSLLAQVGYDGVFLSRVDYNDKNKRLQDKSLELVWETSQQLGSSADIFTHILYNHYTTAAGNCWDLSCMGGDALVFDPSSVDYNLPKLVDGFVEFNRKQRDSLRSDNVVALFGGDFQFLNAKVNFKNIEYIMDAVNKIDGVNMFYSTPSCYLNAVNSANIQLPTKQDDFFPYASEAHTYWTGFYTSRPNLKALEREANKVLQSVNRLASFQQVDQSKIDALKSALGFIQHHQAITGTSKQSVAQDYARMLTKAITGAEGAIRTAINSLSKKTAQSQDLGLESCRLRNISECSISADKSSFLVTVYNPSSSSPKRFVRLPVQNASYTVTNEKGEKIPVQLVPIPDQLSKTPGRNSNTNVELVFNAGNVPFLGFTTFYVTKTGDTPTDYSKVWTPQAGQEVSVGNDDVTVVLDGNTGLLKTIKHAIFSYDLKQSLQYYLASQGNNQGSENRASGAYVFRPQEGLPRTFGDRVEVTVVEGNVITEIHQKFSDWASQVIRIYTTDPDFGKFVEIEWLVGPIDTNGGGKEVISKFETPLGTAGVFYTDTNGRGSIQRKRDYRPTWDLVVDEAVSSNYYPVVSHITVKDSFTTLAVVTDRAQGGSSMQDGNLELMVHRRLQNDDGLGLDESLNDQAYDQGVVARGSHRILLGGTGTDATNDIATRDLEVLQASQPLILLSDVTGRSQQDIANSYNQQWGQTTVQLEHGLVILSLEPYKEGQLLIRLENVFPLQMLQVDLTKLFSSLEVTAARETTLGGQTYIENLKKLQWRKEGVQQGDLPEVRPQAVDLNNVVINAQQIRTFILDVKSK